MIGMILANFFNLFISMTTHDMALFPFGTCIVKMLAFSYEFSHVLLILGF